MVVLFAKIGGDIENAIFVCVLTVLLRRLSTYCYATVAHIFFDKMLKMSTG